MANNSLSALLVFAKKDPFRVFFPLGAALAIAGVLPWTLQFFGKSDYPVAFHKSLMLNGFVLSFVSGFLMTAIPRFTSSKSASGLEIGVVFCAICAGAFVSFCGLSEWSYLTAGIALVSLALFALRRFLTRQMNPPFTFIFVGCGIILWTLANVFLFLGQQGVAFALRHAATWQALYSNGAVMALVLGIGGRLIPGILGWQEIVSIQRNRYEANDSFMASVPISIWALLTAYLLSFALLDIVSLRACLAVRMSVICYFAFRYWKIQHPPFEKTYLTWSIWLSCWCFVAGAFLTLVWPQHYAHLLHVSLIGGFSLLTILIATRVTLAHGEAGKAPEKTWRGIYIFSALIIAAAITRATAIFLPHYLQHLAYAAIIWTVGFTIWAFAMIPRMFSGLKLFARKT